MRAVGNGKPGWGGDHWMVARAVLFNRTLAPAGKVIMWPGTNALAQLSWSQPLIHQPSFRASHETPLLCGW